MTLPKVGLTPGSTSFYSQSEPDLDPRLFAGEKMLPGVRAELMSHYRKNMGSKFRAPEAWSHVWLAGSGASHQWSAERHPSDLDMLVGVDYPEFRWHNQQYGGLTDSELATVLNEHMKKNLNIPDWHGTHEVTWYNNPGGKDIRNINPYAAYSLTKDDWSVKPTPQTSPQYSPDAFGDYTKAQEIVNRYSTARLALRRKDMLPERRQSHADSLNAAIAQGHALFEDIHGSRRAAFLPGGKGYLDPHNVRWQTGKASGVVPAMRALYELYASNQSERQRALYGTELPEVGQLLLQTMLMEG